MARQNSVIAIDLGTEFIKAVALSSDRSEGNLTRVLGASSVPSEGIKKGAIIEVADVAKALKNAASGLEKAIGMKITRAFAGIGGTSLGFQKSKGLVAVSRADNQISKDDIKRAIDASETNLAKVQNREVLHSIPFSFKIDNDLATPDPEGLSGGKLEAETIFITTLSQQLKNIIKTFDEVGIELEDVFASPFALGAGAISKREKEVGVMLLDIGSLTTSLIIFEEGYPYSLEVLPVGSRHITQDIAVGFQISMEEAEKLKVTHGIVGREQVQAKKTARVKNDADDLIYGKYSRKKLSDIIELRLDDIFELIEKHLKKVERVGLLAAGVVIVGGGANLEGIADFTREYLKLPARISYPDSLGGFRDKVRNPSWSASLGVGLLGLEKSSSLNSLSHPRPGTFLYWLKAFLP